MRANETRAGALSALLPPPPPPYAMGNEEDCLKDRKLFVENLGELLSQTNQQVVSAELDDHEIVTVHFEGGDIRVNVNMDSYLGIIKDVLKVF